MSEQNKITSLIEVCLNTAIGFVVSYSAWPFVAALYNIEYTHAQNLGITGIFTILSISRSYIVRRFFNNGLHHVAASIARRFYESTN